MTIAIAALCKDNQGPLIVATEDHMVTSGDVKFEQPQPKIYNITSTSAAMIFGQIASQTEIVLAVQQQTQSAQYSSIEQIAKCYADSLQENISSQADAAVLSPLGLTRSTFLQRQASMNQGLIASLAKQLQEFYVNSGLCNSLGGAIIVGSDSSGGHIYRVEHGQAVLCDAIGFAAAGSGQWHAESQFMFARYTKEWSFTDALSLVYAAKKRAEVAPGVGEETDVVIITTKPQGIVHAAHNSAFIGELDNLYQKYKTKQDTAFSEQRKDVQSYIDALFRRANQLPLADPPSTIGQTESTTRTTTTPQQAS